MGRALRATQIAVLTLVAACYAVPERHALSRQTSGVDAGSEGDADAEAAVDAVPAEDGARDAAGNACQCDETRPICIEATQSCVACTVDEGTCAADQVCDAVRGDCVECLQNSDCEDPTASVCNTATHTCEPCAGTGAADCDHIDGKHVCLAGTCVQCTKDELAACAVQQGGTTVQNACHALEHTCTQHELGKTPPCGECVSDAQCMAGHVCVEMAFGGQPIAGTWYCQPVHDAMNCSGARRFVALASGVVTIDGEVADLCTLRGSSCSAQNDYLKSCGLGQDNQPVPVDHAGEPVAPSVKGDNALCGLPELEDGFCVEVRPGVHRCTVLCGLLSDCPAIAQACVPSKAHATGTEDLCDVR